MTTPVPAHAGDLGDAGDGRKGDGRGTLALVLVAAFILVMDTSLLNVSIPSIGQELGADLSAVRWVVTGKALTYAAFLLVGGRIGDVFGHRRVFIVGGIVYTAGAALGSQADSIEVLFAGEVAIKTIGVTLWLPATMAILASEFRGAQRAMAFAGWGSAVGVAVAFGPVVGGVITASLSWRWSIGASALVTPVLVVVGARILERPVDDAKVRRQSVDVTGALLISSGVLALVYGLSEGPQVGWLRATKSLEVGSLTVWPVTRGVSIVPLLLAAASCSLIAFWTVERSIARRGGHPLLEVAHFRHRTFRYGLFSGIIAATGQWGLLFVLPIFLQLGLGLSPWENGLWQLPSGVAILVGSRVGGRLTRLLEPASVVRIGIACEAAGILAIGLAMGEGARPAELMPGLLVFGAGFGLASAQLANVVISAAGTSHGVAGAASTTSRQLGAALGVAILGALLSSSAADDLARRVETSSGLSLAVRDEVRSTVDDTGLEMQSPAGASPEEARVLDEAVSASVAGSARLPVVLGAAVVGVGALVPARPRASRMKFATS